MKFIKDLYYGNISPWEMIFERDSEYGRAGTVLMESEDKLRKNLKDEDLKNFERFADSTNKILDISCQECFGTGFRLGVELMADVVWGDEKRTLTD